MTNKDYIPLYYELLTNLDMGTNFDIDININELNDMVATYQKEGNKKALILSRVSTHHQDLEQQTQAVINEAKQIGYSDEDIIIIEDKESGVQLDEEERNGLNRMKFEIENNNVGVVLCYEISRISRQPKILYSIRDYLQQHKVQLIIFNPYIKVFTNDFTVSETSNIMFSLFGVMSENEGFIRKARFKRGKEKAKAEGRNFGFPCKYGYTTDASHKIVINQQEATVVKKAFNAYLMGDSINKIGSDMVEAGYVSPFKHPQYAGQWISKILNSTQYLGDGVYPQIISRDIYDKVQHILKSKPHRVAGVVNKDYWCKGLFYYGEELFCVKAIKSSYVTTHSLKSITKDTLHRIAIKVLDEYISQHSPSQDEQEAKKIKEMQMVERRIHTVLKEISDLENKKEDVWVKNVERKISDMRAQKMSDNYDRQIADNRIKLNSLYADRDKISQFRPCDVPKFELYTDEQKHAEINRLVEKVDVLIPDKQHKTFIFHFRDGSTITKNLIRYAKERIS